MNYHKVIENKVQTWIVKAQKDFNYFLFEMCKTNDPHDNKNPVKFFPKYPYLIEIANILQHNQKILIAKARQMMISWICCAYLLWEILFKKYKVWFIVSKKEDVANEMLDRIKFMFNNLPLFIKSRFTVEKSIYCRFQIKETKSGIIAVSQDADALRSFTASGIFSDEMAFQPFAEKSFRGYMPTLENAKFIGVSTPNGKNFFWKLFYDRRL